MAPIICLDTKLSGRVGSIASYLIPYSGGAILVDPGPGSTQENLKSALAEHDLVPEQISHVLLTHIHLDHAGAAGWLAGLGARVLVHPLGAVHMLNPEKLIASARRIYGDKMEELWGEFLPVPANKLTEVMDGDQIEIGELAVLALHTPGHANHHVAYHFQDTCFTGDVGGVRLAGPLYIMLPFVPPETDFEKWRESLDRIRQLKCKNLAITHFGIYEDAQAHLALASRTLDEVERWLESVMPDIPDVDTLKTRYESWLHSRGITLGVSENVLNSYDYSSPTGMAASGLFRYWNKVKPLNRDNFPPPIFRQ